MPPERLRRAGPPALALAAICAGRRFSRSRPRAAGSLAQATAPLTLQTALFGPLTVPDGAARAAEIEELSRRAAVYATRARGDGTRRAYRAAWRQFEAWCRTLGREPLAADPDTIAMYVVRCADQGFAVSSIRVHLAAIRTAHLLAGLSLDLRHPRLAMVVEGVTRVEGRPAAPPGRTRRARRAAPDGRQTPRPPTRPLGARERAMLLLGFGAALRRSELVALTLGDVETVPAAGCACWSAARRPTSRARARTSPSGPTRRRTGSARSPRSTPGSRTGAPPPISTGPPAPPRAPSARCSAPSPRPAGSPGRNSPTRRSPGWSSRPRWMPGSTRSATPATRCAPASPPPPAIRAPASPS